jgi:ribosome-associated toxin RatA of RatAB toxin-antitoxin module
MAHVKKSVLVGYSAAQMFDLVDRVEDYPEFLPWCGGTETKWRDDRKTIATIHIRYLHVTQSFTTENDKHYPQEMRINLIHGPFRHMQGTWRFHALAEDACKVEFDLQYEFSSKLLENLMSSIFHHIAGSLVDAFVHRAEAVYGVSA